jgi:hypothetical protein
MTNSATKEVKAYLRGIGAKGGRKSRRHLDPAEARRMVAVREARRAFRDYYHDLFWSAPADMRVEEEDVPYVVNQLRSEGDRDAYQKAGRIWRLWTSGGGTCR